ncbi:XRE family transcriptional regulator [Nitratidesulfovibrio vulgaris]|uniref:XRE family transcriptional regulator n=1 Tax=Nitratidesulfovibrio vulgaris TaxID=881 RepID=UPI0013E8DC7E|nr:XRE family transcriptional regulator [Nitratidesulfovibrio vulgaris]
MVNRTPQAAQSASLGFTVPRPVALKTFLRSAGYLNTDVAEMFGVTPGRASVILGSDACPEKYRDILRGLQVPEELLPQRSPERPGPQRRRSEAEA